MRPDIKKVICEDGRRGDKSYSGGIKGYEKEHKFRNDEDRAEEFSDLACLPKKESMTKRLRGNTRNFSENLGALRGLIAKNLGKNWDKLYSEICTQVSPTGSNLERHVHQHLGDYIEIQTRVGSNGKSIEFLDYKSEWKSIKEGAYWRRCEYYVHPKTRCICKLKKPPGRKRWLPTAAEKAEERAKVCLETEDPMVQYHKIDGIWYSVKLEAYDIKDEFVRDLIVKAPVTIYGASPYRPTRVIEVSYKMKETYGRQGVRGVSRKQLSSRDMRKHGLTNDPRP